MNLDVSICQLGFYSDLNENITLKKKLQVIQILLTW